MMNAYWTMLSHYHGQILNYSELGRSFGVSDMTVRRYCEILEGAFMVRLLAPWGANVGKRVVRRPKLYPAGQRSGARPHVHRVDGAAALVPEAGRLMGRFCSGVRLQGPGQGG